MDIKLFDTLPNKKDDFWQLVMLPTVTILRRPANERYTVFSVEWLFWSLTIIINDNKRQTTEGIC